MNNRRILASAIGLAIFLGSFWAHAASFIIELNNGREVTTSHVWEEGDEIKFYAPQGTAGVPKALVKRIKPSTVVYHDNISRSTIVPSASNANVSTTDEPSQTNAHRETHIRQDVGKSESSQEPTPVGDKSLKAGDAQAYRAKKQILTDELDAATNTYLAASGARNPDAKKTALNDMRTYSKKIIGLGDEVKAKNGGVLPDWWNE